MRQTRTIKLGPRFAKLLTPLDPSDGCGGLLGTAGPPPNTIAMEL